MCWWDKGEKEKMNEINIITVSLNEDERYELKQLLTNRMNNLSTNRLRFTNEPNSNALLHQTDAIIKVVGSLKEKLIWQLTNYFYYQ
jgi:hypothetical protein